jgi:hypothetical protein
MNTKDLEATLRNFALVSRMEAMLSGRASQYPFNLLERGKYTQHQVTLYQTNFCHTEIETNEEQPAITGGAELVFIQLDF